MTEPRNLPVPPPQDLDAGVPSVVIPQSLLRDLLLAEAERNRYRDGIVKALAWMPHTLTTAMAPDGAGQGWNAARDVLRGALGDD